MIAKPFRNLQPTALSLLRCRFGENTLLLAGSGKHYRKFFDVTRT
jgi:hypothetical protein